MIGWIFVIIAAVIGIVCVGLDIFSKELDGTGVVAGIFLLMCLCVFVCVSYQYHIVNPQFRYDYHKKVLADTRKIITENQSLNLKDMEMGKRISECIQELREFEKTIESCKRSPFSIFKPKIEMDK